MRHATLRAWPHARVAALARPSAARETKWREWWGVLLATALLLAALAS